MSSDTGNNPDYWQRQQILWGLRSCGLSLRTLLLCLAYHQGNNPEAWPSQETLSAELSLSTRQVRTLIKEAVRRGWIAVRRGWSNRYSICWDRLRDAGTSLPDSPAGMRNSTSADKRNSTSVSPARSRKLTSDKHKHENIQKNTHGADAVSKKRNGWKHGGIRDDELQDATLIQARFTEAVESNYCHDEDQLRFFTLAVHVANSKARSPGALFTRLLKGKTWPGTDQQEDQARSLIREIDRQQAGPANCHATTLGAVLQSDYIPRRDQDD